MSKGNDKGMTRLYPKEGTGVPPSPAQHAVAERPWSWAWRSPDHPSGLWRGHGGALVKAGWEPWDGSLRSCCWRHPGLGPGLQPAPIPTGRWPHPSQALTLHPPGESHRTQFPETQPSLPGGREQRASALWLPDGTPCRGAVSNGEAKR